MKGTLNMTEGNILKVMMRFAVPVLLGSVFQQLYNLADTAIVGNLLGDNAIAAVGAAAPVFSLIISLSNGFTNGFSVVVARFFGAGDEKKFRRSVTLGYVMAALISIGMTVCGLLGLKPLLEFLKTPQDIINDSEAYLRILISFCAAPMFYNLFAGLFRAIGNSRIPLYFLILSTMLNIGMDYCFVKFLDMGVRGAAAATVIAQAVSVLLCVLCVAAKYRILAFKPKHLHFDIGLMWEMFTTGLSMAMMFAIVSIGSIALQNAVNSFGSRTVEAHVAARKYDELFMLPISTMVIIASTFASQNFGAGKIDRVKKGIATALIIAFCWSGVALAASLFASYFVVKLITGTKDTAVISTALKYISINVPFFPVLAILVILRSTLQGLGRKVIPLLSSMIELTAKFAAVAFLAPALGYTGVCILEPMIWTVCAMLVLTDFCLFVKRKKKEAASCQ